MDGLLVKEEFCLQERLQALEKEVPVEELMEPLFNDAPPGCMGLICQPHWTPGPELASYTKVPITEVRATGGGARSDAIVQITADIFGLPVRRPHTNETSLLGAAIDAAVGSGFFPGFNAAVASMTRMGRTFEPTKENAEIYRDLYRRVYLKMYKKLRPLNKEIRAITGYPE